MAATTPPVEFTLSKVEERPLMARPVVVAFEPVALRKVKFCRVLEELTSSVPT